MQIQLGQVTKQTDDCSTQQWQTLERRRSLFPEFPHYNIKNSSFQWKKTTRLQRHRKVCLIHTQTKKYIKFIPENKTFNLLDEDLLLFFSLMQLFFIYYFLFI